MGVLIRRHRLGLLGVALLGLVGCSFGPTALERNRTKYNEAVRETWNEQFLLNIVRLRYRDPTQFDAVTNILSSHQFAANLSEQEQWRTGAGHAPNPSTNTMLFTQWLLTPSGGIQESPTITFSPLEGADFTRSLLGPIHLETLVLLSNTGWDVDRVMRLTISNLNGIENVTQVSGEIATSPRFEEFTALAQQLRHLQLRGWLELGYDDFERQLAEPIKLREDLTPSEVMSAADKKYEFHIAAAPKKEDNKTPEANGGKKTIIRVRPGPLTAEIHDESKPPERKLATLFGKERYPVERIKLDAWADPHGAPLVAHMLHIEPGLGMYRLVWAAEGGQLKPPEMPGQDVVVSTRSVLGMLLYASRAVEVPRKHLEEGLVRDPVDEQGQVFDWSRVLGDMLHVKVQKIKPAHAFVATHYRGYWFYIDDADLSSKSTFALIQLVTGLELAGGVVPGPVVTVPAGGGGVQIAPGGGGGGGGGRGGGSRGGGG